MHMPKQTIFHIVDEKTWDQAQKRGVYQPPSFEAEGFIHFSSRKQILPVANALYPGREDLLLLWVSVKRLEGEVVWEPPKDQSSDPNDKFPHLYGPLNLCAVIKAVPFKPNSSGIFERIPQY